MHIVILVKQVYSYTSQVSGERLQDHWSGPLIGQSQKRKKHMTINIDYPP